MKIPYWMLAVVPQAMFWLGFALNSAVIAVNGGQMPVQFPGGCITPDEDIMIHQCLTSATHLKFLCDWILVRGGILPFGFYSPGDFVMLAGAAAMTPCLIALATLILNDYGFFKKPSKE
jgi:hypothetical protein